jgi:hypothetical protein
MVNIKFLVEKLQKVIAEDQQAMIPMTPMSDSMGFTEMNMESTDEGVMSMPSSNDEKTTEMFTGDIKSETTEMFMGDIRSMIVNADEILDHIEQGKEIEPWMQGKITLAADYVSAVRDYLIGKE